MSTSKTISSQYFFKNDFVFRISRYATTSSAPKRLTIIQKITSKVAIISGVIGNRGSGNPRAECSIFTRPKKNTKISVNVVKLIPFLNNGDMITLDNT